jgi:nicotinate-nucleotide pyrophosphorylase (carboxylating)
MFLPLKAAVKLNANRAILEASGGIDISNVREIALTGVDRISIGDLTKNISAIDLSMRFSNI